MDTDRIQLSDSEWKNVSNFENIYLCNGDGVNEYDITLTNSLIANNHDDEGFLNIHNFNDEANVTLDAISLSEESNFKFDGTNRKRFSYRCWFGCDKRCRALFCSRRSSCKIN